MLHFRKNTSSFVLLDNKRKWLQTETKISWPGTNI